MYRYLDKLLKLGKNPLLQDYIDSESHFYEGEKLSQAEEGMPEMSLKEKMDLEVIREKC